MGEQQKHEVHWLNGSREHRAAVEDADDARFVARCLLGNSNVRRVRAVVVIFEETTEGMLRDEAPKPETS